jgi:uncharacterized protein YcbX
VTDQELSRRLGTPLQVRAESTIRHHDEAPLQTVTTRDLDALADRCGDQPIDVRRFRPNLLLGAAADLPSSVWSAPFSNRRTGYSSKGFRWRNDAR